MFYVQGIGWSILIFIAKIVVFLMDKLGMKKLNLRAFIMDIGCA